MEVAELNEAYAASVARSPLRSGRDTYRTLADCEADMARLDERHPDLVKRFALPRPSLDGRTIYAVEIGHEVRRPADGRPTFLLMGLHHAREWPSGELAMDFAFDLVENFGKSDRITRLLRKARVIVVPVVNPDGFELSRTDGEKESVDIVDAAAGTYVLRVINYASASPTYTLTESLFDAVTKRTDGERVSYLLTCEKGGKVLQRQRVFIGRGDAVRLDLAECRRKA